MNTHVGQYYFDFASEEFCIQRWRSRFERHLRSLDTEGAHDIGHVRRVWANCKAIADEIPTVDMLALLAMAYLHDLVPVSKGSPDRSSASTYSAEKAGLILMEMKFPSDLLSSVKHGISAHSYSARIAPKSTEGQILSDADKIDALGSVGFARLIYTAGTIGSALFDLDAPVPLGRDRREDRYALDHVFEKLVCLPEMMFTKRGRVLAADRLEILLSQVDALLTESGYRLTSALRDCVHRRTDENVRSAA